MSSERPVYAVPSIASFSESEIMDHMGSATQYEVDSLPTDPADPGGHKKGKGKGKGGKH